MRYSHCKTRILSLTNIKALSSAHNFTDSEFRHLFAEYTKCSRHNLQTLDASISESDRENASLLASAVTSLTTGIAPPVAFPTETVYGLGADATNPSSIAGIFSAKGRPSDNPLIVHVSSVDHLERCLGGPIPSVYTELVREFWPGPLTILVPVPEEGKGVKFAPNVHPGQKTIGFRVPSSPYARFLIAAADRPIAAPSANSSGKPSPTTAQHVKHDLDGKINFILDGGSCGVGVESTVVDGLGEVPLILRPGGLSKLNLRNWGVKMNNVWQHVENGWEAKHSRKRKADDGERTAKVRRLDLEERADMFESPATRSPVDHDLQTEDDGNAAPRAPGMKYKHYAPAGKLYLVEKRPETEGEAFIEGILENLEFLVGLYRTNSDEQYDLARGFPCDPEESYTYTRKIGILIGPEWPDTKTLLEHFVHYNSAIEVDPLVSGSVGADVTSFRLSWEDIEVPQLQAEIHVFNLGKTPDAMAQNLFAVLRSCDTVRCDFILAEAAPVFANSGSGPTQNGHGADDPYETVKERMRKAASHVVTI